MPARTRKPAALAASPVFAPSDTAAAVEALRALGATVATGRFRADMDVELVNDGPVTLMLEV